MLFVYTKGKQTWCEVYSQSSRTSFSSSVCVRSLVDNNLLIKYVLFNGTDVNWWATPNTYNSQWLSIGLHMTLSEFNPTVAYDFVVTVRGSVQTLCPAVTFMQVRGENRIGL